MRNTLVALALSALIAHAQTLAQPAGAISPRTDAPAAYGQIRILERWRIDPSRLAPDERAPRRASLLLTVVIVDATRWKRDAAERTVEEAVRVVAQCGIRTARAELLRVQAPQPFRFLYTPASRRLASELRLDRPTIYLVEDTLNRPAFDAEAFGLGNTRGRPELANSVWITAATRHAGIALAHELVHVLTDSGEHVEDTDNLMNSETSPERTRLTEAQCGRAIERGVANGLLARLPE